MPDFGVDVSVLAGVVLLVEAVDSLEVELPPLLLPVLPEPLVELEGFPESFRA